MPAVVDLVGRNAIRRGDATTLRFRMVDADGSPQYGSIASQTSKLTIRQTPETSPAWIDKAGSVYDAGSASSPGIFEVALTRAETLALPVGRWVYAFSRMDSGFEGVLTTGICEVVLNVRDV